VEILDRLAVCDGGAAFLAYDELLDINIFTILSHFIDSHHAAEQIFGLSFAKVYVLTSSAHLVSFRVYALPLPASSGDFLFIVVFSASYHE
jgi:hypothetical protein